MARFFWSRIQLISDLIGFPNWSKLSAGGVYSENLFGWMDCEYIYVDQTTFKQDGMKMSDCISKHLQEWQPVH